MNKAKKSAVAAGLTLGLLGGGGAGLVLGSTGVSGAQDATTTSEAPAQAPDGERPERGEKLSEALAPLVTDGTINQEQADAVIGALEAAGPEGGPGGRGGPGGHNGHRGGFNGDAAATALGMTSDEVREALKDGQTLAEVAEAQGVDVQVVIDAMVAEASSKLQERVSSGDMTQEDADAKIAELSERITEQVNNAGPERSESGSETDGD